MEPEYPFLEADDEFEGVGAHRDNPRFDLATALEDAADYPDVDPATGDERQTTDTDGRPL